MGLEELRDYVTASQRNQLAQQAILEVPERDFPELSPDIEHPTLDDIAELEDEREAAKARLVEARARFVNERFEAWLKGFSQMTEEDVRKLGRGFARQARITTEFSRVWNNWTIHQAFYLDEKFTRRAFSSPEAVMQLPGQVYNLLLARYAELDAFSFNVNALKN